MILYLHGFLSSPGSAKAGLLRAALEREAQADDFLCPQLPVSPRATAELLLALAQLEDPQRLSLIGSSLGGYYATWLAERLGCRAVLLNPAVRPYDFLGVQFGGQGEPAQRALGEVRPEHLDELRALETGGVTDPVRYLLIAATGDEVIDYRLMVEKYAACTLRIVAGSDHALSDFAHYLPEVLRFCAASPATGGGQCASS